MNIPKEAVEVAAKVVYDFRDGVRGDEEIARLALESAAPLMYAQALEDAVHAFPLETIVAPDNAVVWMMRRAEELRSKL